MIDNLLVNTKWFRNWFGCHEYKILFSDSIIPRYRSNSIR